MCLGAKKISSQELNIKLSNISFHSNNTSMAITQTTSNPRDWLSQSHHTDFFNFSQTETPTATVAAAGGTSIISRSNDLSLDQGRVAKPVRRARSRTSRRTPTTLLNTDKANFRAMVQRFTGGPAAAYAAGYQVPNGGGAINFMEHVAAARGGGAHLPSSGYYVKYPNQELQRQQMMFMLGGGGVGSEAPPSWSDSGNENRSYDNYML
ncbi:hypothetical protein OROGR_000071 [Orobanche gracilis]